jgi:hypothetical protein
VVEQQLQVPPVREAEQRPEVVHGHRELLGREELVERPGEARGPLVEPLLQPGTLVAQPGEDRLGRDHGHRVLDVGAAEERGVAARHAVVAVGPEAAVDPVHDVGPTRDGADRVAAADELAVRREVRPHAEDALRALLVRPEPGQHLVEHQHDAVLVAQLAQRADELDGLAVRVPARHRLQHDRRDLAGVSPDHVQARLVAVAQHERLGHGRRRHAG